MSAAIPMEGVSARSLVSAPVVEPTLTDSVCGLLRALSRGARASDSLHLRAEAGNVFGISTAGSVPVSEVSEKWLPPMVLRMFEDRANLPWRVSLAAMRGLAGLDPSSLSAVAVSFTIERAYRNPTRPDSPNGKRWVWPEDRVAEVLASLEAFQAPPSMVISALPAVVAVWSLDMPIPVTNPLSQASAMLLLRALAARVGAVVPADDLTLADLSVPLPGVAAASQAHEIVEVPAFDPERTYTLQDIEAFVAEEK